MAAPGMLRAAKSGRSDWGTPSALYDLLDAEFVRYDGKLGKDEISPPALHWGSWRVPGG